MCSRRRLACEIAYPRASEGPKMSVRESTDASRGIRSASRQRPLTLGSPAGEDAAAPSQRGLVCENEGTTTRHKRRREQQAEEPTVRHRASFPPQVLLLKKVSYMLSTKLLLAARPRGRKTESDRLPEWPLNAIKSSPRDFDASGGPGGHPHSQTCLKSRFYAKFTSSKAWAERLRTIFFVQVKTARSPGRT